MALIFDLDGTLSDPVMGIGRSLNYALESLGYPLLTAADIPPLVGPPLDRFASRAYVAGVLPNTSQNLVAWISNPPAIDPLSAMPATGISEAEARDAAASLYTLY